MSIFNTALQLYTLNGCPIKYIYTRSQQDSQYINIIKAQFNVKSIPQSLLSIPLVALEKIDGELKYSALG